MSDTFRPWDEVFGPATSPENVVIPTPVPTPVVLPEPSVPAPVPQPAPVIPAPTPTAPQSQSKLPTIAAALIVAAGMLGAGFFISKNKAPVTPVTPNGPVLPVVDSNLSKLLPDDNARTMVGSYFRDVSKFLETSKALKTSGQVIEAIQVGAGDIKRTIGDPNWSAINTPISDRVIKAMGSTPAEGFPDLPLDTPHLNGMTPRQILVKEYAQIGADAKGG